MKYIYINEHILQKYFYKIWMNVGYIYSIIGTNDFIKNIKIKNIIFECSMNLKYIIYFFEWTRILKKYIRNIYSNKKI